MDKKEKTIEFYNEQNDEIIQLVNKVKTSDDNLAFEQICKKMDKYIHSVMSKFFISGFTNDDISQECLIALRFKAINDYDEGKGPFIKFAKLCIRRHIITELKACKKKKNLALNSAVSLDKSFNDTDDESTYTLLDMIPDKSTNDHFKEVSIRERGRLLYHHLARDLTELEYRILIYYVKGYNYMEVVHLLRGDKLLTGGDDDLDKKAVDNGLCRIKKKALELKKQIEEQHYLQDDMFIDLTHEIGETEKNGEKV